MDAAFMGKRIFADNRFVELHCKPRNRRHAAWDIHDLGRIDIGIIGHDIAAHF